MIIIWVVYKVVEMVTKDFVLGLELLWRVIWVQVLCVPEVHWLTSQEEDLYQRMITAFTTPLSVSIQLNVWNYVKQFSKQWAMGINYLVRVRLLNWLDLDWLLAFIWLLIRWVWRVFLGAFWDCLNWWRHWAPS